MKNDLSCEIVQDLLPSYTDGLACSETKAAVERHLAECPRCSDLLRRMRAPVEERQPEKKEIDYLKKVRCRSSRHALAAVVAALLLTAAGIIRIFCIGFPVGEGAIAAVVSVADGSARVTGTLADSGQSVCRVRISENENGVVNIRVFASPALFRGNGDFTREFPLREDVSRISVNGLVLWENGEPVAMLAARLYAGLD